MGWLNKILGKSGKVPLVSIQTPTGELSTAPIQTTNIVREEKKDEVIVLGVDQEFIDLLYFPTTQRKEEYITNVEQAIAELKLKEITEDIEIRKRIHEHNEQIETQIPFLIDAISFEHYYYKPDRNKGGYERVLFDTRKGKDKLTYYTALNLFNRNLELGISVKNFDFQSEENLLLSSLKNDHMNFIGIQSLAAMGMAFAKANNLEKRDEYFNMILNDKYELAEATVSNFYREIADHYLPRKDKPNAIKWYKAGLQLNPKLGVKKQLASLEKE